jgi:6-phosphogluconolactonase
MSMKGKLQIYPTRAELVQAVAELIVTTTTQAIKERDFCAIALAGGNTPREVYRALATEPFRNRIDWNKLHLFWGDERNVPPDHPQSNFGMVREAMLAHHRVPETNIHRIKGEIAAEQAAKEYAEELKKFFQNQRIRFDLVLLGIGEDGHTASLFPGTDAVAEISKPVTAVFVPRLDKWRVTLTFPVINSASKVAFVVAGKSKAQIIENLLKLHKPDPQWPASMVQPQSGVLFWLMDADAAANIRDVGLTS